MKKLLLLMLISIFFNTTYILARWINPPYDVCVRNSAKLEFGICRSTWYQANRICEEMGTRLPTIDELGVVITDCGVELNAENSENNSTYQSCIKNMGFHDEIRYWSSLTFSPNDTIA